MATKLLSVSLSLVMLSLCADAHAGKTAPGARKDRQEAKRIYNKVMKSDSTLHGLHKEGMREANATGVKVAATNVVITTNISLLSTFVAHTLRDKVFLLGMTMFSGNTLGLGQAKDVRDKLALKTRTKVVSSAINRQKIGAAEVEKLQAAKLINDPWRDTAIGRMNAK
jgi:hypothetical protein